ncbi:hypothetical protein KKC59_03500 [bacterium]|nr:hypothetical protein [bacterium]
MKAKSFSENIFTYKALYELLKGSDKIKKVKYRIGDKILSKYARLGEIEDEVLRNEIIDEFLIVLEVLSYFNFNQLSKLREDFDKGVSGLRSFVVKSYLEMVEYDNQEIDLEDLFVEGSLANRIGDKILDEVIACSA